MTWKVLITAPYMLPEIGRFEPFFAENDIEVTVADVEERLEEAELLPLVADVHGVICGDDRFTERVISAAPRLRVICKWGTGIDSIDSKAAERLGIRVCRTPDAFTQPVADSVMGYVLCFARGLPWMNGAMKDGRWEKIPGLGLNELTLGVIGVGCIGSAILHRAKSFGMSLLGNDVREIDPALITDTGVEMVEIGELLARSDFVSINCDLNPTSDHLLGRAAFAAMKDTAVCINLARGPIVDEVALVDALRAGQIAGAALDVFEHEPLPVDSPLFGMDNVMLAPHNSNSSPSAWERVHQNTLHELLDGLRGTGRAQQ